MTAGQTSMPRTGIPAVTEEKTTVSGCDSPKTTRTVVSEVATATRVS